MSPPATEGPSVQQIVEDLGLSKLGESPTPDELLAVVRSVQDWRLNGPDPAIEGLVREEFRRLLNAAGQGAPLKLWDSIAPPPYDPSAQKLEPEPAPLDPELVAKAEALLERPDLLSEAYGLMQRRGLQGEPLNARVLALACIGGHLGEPFHIVLKGDSAAGKNNQVRHATDLLPPQRVLTVTGMSAHALVYQGGTLEGVLVIDEAEGQREANYAIRVAMSEGKISRLSEPPRDHRRPIDLSVSSFAGVCSSR